MNVRPSQSYKHKSRLCPTQDHLTNYGNTTADQPLPAESSLTETGFSRRGIITGFPHPSTRLPENLDHETIIKRYPNHLRGKLLLQISGTWTAKEISATSGRPELKANTLVKRIRVARLAEGNQKLPRAPRRKIITAKRAAVTSQPPQKTAPQEEPIPPPHSPFSALPASPHSSSVLSSPPSISTSTSTPPTPTTFTESHASQKFHEEQLAIRNILQEMDPQWSDRQYGARRRRAHQDRMLVQTAVAEYERRRAEAGVVQGRG